MCIFRVIYNELDVFVKVTNFFSILSSRELNNCFGVCGYQFAVKIILFGTCAGLVKCSGVLVNRSLLLWGRQKSSSLYLTFIFTIQRGGVGGKGLKMLCCTFILNFPQHL